MIDHPALSDKARTPPKKVAEAAERGLALREEHGRGGTEVGVRRAHQLMERRTVSDRDIKSMYSYFARHAVDKRGRNWADRDKPSAGYIAWLLWGGDDARDWIDGLRKTLREAGGVSVADAASVPEGLTWCSDDHPGFKRTASGRGFAWHDRKGELIRDEKTLARLRALAIPPAWTDVWACPRASGHIQATGRDAKGRKQYRYHPDWSAHAAESKFERLPDFARALPKLRRRVEADLARRGPCREKVLATAVRLLEITLIRVGNAQYARQNRSYGLTTLHKRHLEVDGSALIFAFKGKSGIEHEVKVRDRRLATVVRSLRELPGQQLFKYRDADGDVCTVSSDDVNAYIREAMGEQFSAKDFRTWAGTVSAARALRDMEPPASPTEAKRRINVCVRAVAGLLGNTPTVCRASYVHPKVFELYEAGELAGALPGPEAKTFESALIKTLA